MTIAQTWVEYAISGTSFVQSDNDISVLDFGNIAVSGTANKYIGLRYMGCGSDNIKLWMDGAYADVYPYNTNNAVQYEVDITQAPHNIAIYGKLVNSSSGISFTAGDIMPDKNNPLSLSGHVDANYASEGYSAQVLAIQINTSGTLTTDNEYHGLKLMLCYDTLQ